MITAKRAKGQGALEKIKNNFCLYSKKPLEHETD